MTPENRNVVVVHYDELALKGGNRDWFEECLLREIREACGRVDVRKRFGRFVVAALPGGPDLSELLERLVHLPGIRYLLQGVDAGDSLDEVLRAVGEVLPTDETATFGVRTRRAKKRHPLTSQQFSEAAGGRVLELRPGWRVNLKTPDHWIQIEIVNDKALVCSRRREAPGGLPVGVSGRGIALLSGGIDSPVAAWQMLVRGLRLSLLHFHSAPYTTAASQDKVRELAQLLCRAQPSIDLTMVAFADPIQQTIVQKTPERYRVILYRRFMMRLAYRAAQTWRAKCIVTGEALGQVASQTIENLTTVQAVCSLPVLRPLVGANKAWIVDRARAIGTFDVSTLPHEDCCSFLMPKRPATKTTPEEVAEIEEALDIEDLVERSWQDRTRERLTLHGGGGAGELT